MFKSIWNFIINAFKVVKTAVVAPFAFAIGKTEPSQVTVDKKTFSWAKLFRGEYKPKETYGSKSRALLVTAVGIMVGCVVSGTLLAAWGGYYLVTEGCVAALVPVVLGGANMIIQPICLKTLICEL